MNWGDAAGAKPGGKPWEQKWETPPEDPGLLGNTINFGKQLTKEVAGYAGKGLDALDSYTGAPGRAATRTLQLEGPSGILDAARAFKNQFGEDTANAPSARDVRKGFGIPDLPAPEVLGRAPGMLGPAAQVGYAMAPDFLKKMDLGDMAVGAATDPLTYVPVGGLIEGASKMKNALVGGKEVADIAQATKPAVQAAEEIPALHSKNSWDVTNFKEAQKQFQSVDPKNFIKARSKNFMKDTLSPLKPDDLKSHKLFMSDDGVGYAVSPEGDLQNVFNNSGRKGAGEQAVIEAISKHGAKTADAYGDFLKQYYNDLGFNLTQSVKFDTELAPKGWDYAKYGKPDVHFFEYPASLARDSAEVAKRAELARAERIARLAGERGPLGDSVLFKPDGTIDWSTWRGMGEAEPPKPVAPMGMDSESVIPMAKKAASFAKQFSGQMIPYKLKLPYYGAKKLGGLIKNNPEETADVVRGLLAPHRANQQ